MAGELCCCLLVCLSRLLLCFFLCPERLRGCGPPKAAGDLLSWLWEEWECEGEAEPDGWLSSPKEPTVLGWGRLRWEDAGFIRNDTLGTDLQRVEGEGVKSVGALGFF